ncbi:P-loop containing nucleoside triphosphate hydrolase protein [Crassisporium funariophilum]|nr:P-loop containing nucleoside triphosphate hydrolase protein [Crassisporium funariophilum]
MSGKPTTGTRTSSRVKATPTIAAVPRATRARTALKSVTPPAEPVAPTTKKAVVRKPLVRKDNSLESAPPPLKAKAKTTAIRKTGKVANGSPESDREPIMAYLRIRPRLGEDEISTSPYLTSLSDTAVNMTDPQDPQNGRSKYRFSAVAPSSTYTFSHVFPPNTVQSEFFTKTTLPLVRDALMGQNGLLFTYGVTNSGKTYTVQGGTEGGTAGILPRSLDVIFNSIEGLQGDGRYRPVRLHGIELADDIDSRPPPTRPEPALAEVLGSFDNTTDLEFDIDPTTVKVDRNYEYTIWISYAEVYNEKVYDLLASVKDESAIHTDGTVPRPAGGKSLLLTRQALPLRPSPKSDNIDSDSTGKYIAGLRQFRVHSSSQAKALVRLGQLHRRVFGTLANRESSRSHGMVVIKVVRGHRGERDDPTSLQTSRLTLVDLAGSERTKHTHTTGDRLKEAGNINKSLMVLGQCMEVMRLNQRKIATSLSHEGLGKDGRVDTRDVKKGLAVVPFRHSKLTEALMDYFVGDGRTVMIVNVNPYDTGYDENSHVMKFAALAREVYVTPAPAPVQRIPVAVGPGKLHGNKIKQLGPLTLKDPEIVPRPYTNSRKVTISMGGQKSGKKPVEAILEVLEEDEPTEELDMDQDDDYPINPLVDALFDEVENLRLQLFESEMRCAIIEAETREEVMREMEDRMRAMEQMYSRRMMSEFEQNEIKTDAKIDLLHQSGLFGSPMKKSQRAVVYEEVSEEEDVEMSLIDYGEEELSEDSADRRSMSFSPLGKKGKAKAVSKPQRKSSVAPQPIIEKRPFIPDPPMLPSDSEDAELSETEFDEEDGESIAPSGTTASALGDEEEDEDYSTSEDDEEEDWEPPYSKDHPMMQLSPSASPSPSRPQPKVRKAAPKVNPRASELSQEMNRLNIGEGGVDDSVIILPRKAYRKSTEVIVEDDDDDDDEFDIPIVKKKKRQLGKKPVVTEDGINKLTYAVERDVAKTQRAGSIRRLGK